MKCLLFHMVMFICFSTPALALDPDLDKLRLDLKPLDASVPYAPTPTAQDYFNFYDLDPANVKHWFGTVASEGQILAVHIFMPQSPVGTVFLVHGFLDHVGLLSRLIHDGVSRNYAVVAWDLPGHGLSSGGPTETGDFGLCAAQMEEILARLEDRLPGPVHLVAHSTGASIVMEYLHNTDTSRLDQVVLLAPLVHHAQWGLGKFGYIATSSFMDHIGRRARVNSSDAAFLEFTRQDPLRIETVSYEYLQDLYRWEERAREYPELKRPVLILQGDLDKVVDWEYNLEFLRRKMPGAEIRIIHGARHQLVNESDEYRSRVFDLVFGWLSKKLQ